MFKILIPFIYVTAAIAGVGGIAGGSTDYQRGTHILFQKESMYVDVLNSRTLCQNGRDFRATLKTCASYMRDSEGNCLDYERKTAYQPIHSSRDRCDKWDNDKCSNWKVVPFFQSPKVLYEIKDDNQKVQRTRKIVVPSCN